MRTRQDLQDRGGGCLAGGDRAEAATETVRAPDDLDWVVEVLENGVEWAATDEEILGLADRALRALNNAELGIRFMERAREMCRTPVERARLADTAFATVADTILGVIDDPAWRTSLELQLEKRARLQRQYATFMKREQDCATCAGFMQLARDVHRSVGDIDYCRRLYAKAQHRAAFFGELLAVAEGVARHVGDVDWLGDICQRLLSRRRDLVSVNAVVAVMTAHLPDGRQRADALYRAMEAECESSGCYIRLAVSVLALLEDKDRCRELYWAADRAACTQAELILLARSIEEKLEDRPWVEALYVRAMDLCQTGLEFAWLIRAVTGSSWGFADFLRHLHERAEEVLCEPEDLALLAESVAVHCQDAPWSRRLYERLERSPASRELRLEAASAVLRLLGDSDLTAKLRA